MFARLCLPRSTMCQLAGTFSAGIVLYSEPRVTSLEITTSTGSTTLTPCSSAAAMIRAGVLDAIRLGEALADGLALGEQERVGHAAADDHDVDLVEQVLEHLDLVADLGAADDGRERPLRVVEQLAEVGELALHQQAGVGGAELRDADGARRARGGRCRTRRSRRCRSTPRAPRRTPGRSAPPPRGSGGSRGAASRPLRMRPTASSVPTPSASPVTRHRAADQLAEPLGDGPQPEAVGDLAVRAARGGSPG